VGQSEEFAAESAKSDRLLAVVSAPSVRAGNSRWATVTKEAHRKYTITKL